MNNPITANPGIINQHRKNTRGTGFSHIRAPMMIRKNIAVPCPLSGSSIRDLLEIYWRNFNCNFCGNTEIRSIT